MKTGCKKKYLLKILKRNPIGKDTLIVELSEILEQDEDTDFSNKNKADERETIVIEDLNELEESF